jgi:A/G-specific adenine glycosylase
MPAPAHKDAFAELLLEWYFENRYSYPWRYTNNPFLVLVSEFLLQQTKSDDAVEPYKTLIGSYRSVEELAEADISFLRELFQRLGLFYRAGRLLSAARFIVSEYGGLVPSTIEELLRIPGVGLYTANAVICFGFSRRAAVVDTNVIRIYSRVFQLKSSYSRPRQDRRIWEFADSMLPDHGCADFNYALLDFGRLVCRSRNPRCSDCPLQKLCLYRKTSNQESAEAYA